MATLILGAFIDQPRDFNVHFDYVHWNPAKHGWVRQVDDWPYSSFHRFVELGIYPMNWGHSGDFNIQLGRAG